MAVAPELLEAGEAAGAARGAGSAVSTSQRMPRQPGYLTRQQVGQLNSDSAEYEDMKRRESGETPRRPQRASGGSGGRTRSSGSSRPANVSRTVVGASKAVTKGGRTPTIVRLIYGVMAGLVVLELASMATGRQFHIRIPGAPGKDAAGRPINTGKRPYQPLYSTQAQAISPVAPTAASQAAAAQAAQDAAIFAAASDPSTVGQRMSALASHGINTGHGPIA